MNQPTMALTSYMDASLLTAFCQGRGVLFCGFFSFPGGPHKAPPHKIGSAILSQQRPLFCLPMYPSLLDISI